MSGCMPVLQRLWTNSNPRTMDSLKPSLKRLDACVDMVSFPSRRPQHSQANTWRPLGGSAETAVQGCLFSLRNSGHLMSDFQ